MSPDRKVKMQGRQEFKENNGKEGGESKRERTVGKEEEQAEETLVAEITQGEVGRRPWRSVR